MEIKWEGGGIRERRYKRRRGKERKEDVRGGM